MKLAPPQSEFYKIVRIFPDDDDKFIVHRTDMGLEQACQLAVKLNRFYSRNKDNITGAVLLVVNQATNEVLDAETTALFGK